MGSYQVSYTYPLRITWGRRGPDSIYNFVHTKWKAPYQTSFLVFSGYPNVGKSSLMNGLVGHKVVSVSKTPGHTKHFQTIYLTPHVKLCDCPGLVFPSLVPKSLQAWSFTLYLKKKYCECRHFRDVLFARKYVQCENISLCHIEETILQTQI